MGRWHLSPAAERVDAPWVIAAQPASTPVPPVRVLVVDDEADQSELLCTHLRRAGCATERVDSAERALQLPRDPAPDLVVIDLLLPGLDGWGLSRALAERWPDSPVVVCSVVDSRDYPADTTPLPKPFTGPDVRAVLRRLVPHWSDTA